MISLKTFIRQKMAQYVMILFAGILLLANVIIFTISSIQFERESKRQEESFTEMMIHLLTMESTDTAITYIEHYNHIHGIEIGFFDQNEVLIFETSTNYDKENPIILKNTSNDIIGYIYFDDQNSVLGSELMLGLLLMNAVSIIVFLFFIKLMFNYLNSWSNLLQADFSIVGNSDERFNFEEIHQLSERLEKSQETERRLKEYQKEYVKMLAHDIKTPLTVIKAYLDGARLKKVDLNDEVLNDLLKEVDEIEAMIPKFMNENIESTSKNQNISIVIKEIINRLSEVFSTKNIDVKTKIDDYMMNISYLDISRLIEHLLFNSFYYNHENGFIEIELNAKEKTLKIKDNGIGMSEETLNKINKGNYRSFEAKQMNINGSGVGLQIVREIISRLKLTMEIISKESVGTTVTIKLK